ncbi:helix-turn-helix domain-containing protein [Streptomyces sp. LN590]|uniref:helix-turn-helix domain-containing protein n=1 Tax=Streptomyces sp. LN590 TaxID=3112980 RepID=UPI00371D2CCB
MSATSFRSSPTERSRQPDDHAWLASTGVAVSQLAAKMAARPTTFQFTSAGSTAPGQFQRARVALDAADGRADAAIARELGVHLSTVRRRRKRFHTAGPAALQDRKRPGHRPRYGPEVHWRSWTPQLSARVHAELGQLHLRVADVSRQPGQMDPVPQGAPERGPLVQRPRLFRCQAIAVASES